MTRALPLDFSLRDRNREAVLLLGGPQELMLEIQNTSPSALSLEQVLKEHHFSLRFRAGILNDHANIRLHDANRKHWDLESREDEGDVVIGLRHKTARDWAPDGKLHFKLEGLRGDITGGTRSTRVELSYNHILDGEGVLLTGKPRHHMVLAMASAPAVQSHPLLAAHVVGHTGNIVLNDGHPLEHPIELRLTNTTAERLHIRHATAFRVTLAGGPEHMPGALATKGALRDSVVTAHLMGGASANSPVPLECTLLGGGLPVWNVHAPGNSAGDLWLAPDSYLEIKIAKLVTKHRGGPSDIHVSWQNLGYADGDTDGEVVATVQKSPLVVDSHKVGIGTSQPRAALDVRGDVEIEGRIRSGSLEVDGPLLAKVGLSLGAMKLVAKKFRDDRRTETEPRHYTAEQFEAFEGWPTSLSQFNPLTFSFAIPSPYMVFVAARAWVGFHVRALNPPGRYSGVDFGSGPLAAIVTADEHTLTATLDLGSVVTVTDIPVQEGTKTLEIFRGILPGRVTDLEDLRGRLADDSASAGMWAHGFGRNGVTVSWAVEASCSVAALFAEPTDIG